jgi:hypothetical protein
MSVVKRIMQTEVLWVGEMVHLLWFVKEMPEGKENIELLIGVYSTD